MREEDVKVSAVGEEHFRRDLAVGGVVYSCRQEFLTPGGISSSEMHY